MSCSCNVSRMYPYVEFRDRHTEKIEDLVVGHTGVFFTHHGVRYYKPNDSCKFCKLSLDLHGVTLRDLSDEFCCIVYDPDNPNDISQSESSNFPCESCMHKIRERSFMMVPEEFNTVTKGTLFALDGDEWKKLGKCDMDEIAVSVDDNEPEYGNYAIRMTHQEHTVTFNHVNLSFKTLCRIIGFRGAILWKIQDILKKFRK